MAVPQAYKPRSFDLNGLHGISDRTLEMHFKLYEGYVHETNRLNERLAALLHENRLHDADKLVFSELKRRLGFESNGMILHELYFDNMKRDGGGEPRQGAAFERAVEVSFGSYDTWKTEFAAIGDMRGVGWAICFQDPKRGRISNHWITLHEDGYPAGFVPLLVMDVWEHAFLLDHAPAERGRYIEAFFSNIDWDVVEKRTLKT